MKRSEPSYIRFLIFFAALGVTSQGMGQEAPVGLVERRVQEDNHSKTLEECFVAALKRSEQVSINMELIKQAEATYRQAIGAVLPNLSGAGSYQYQQNNAGVYSNFYPNPSTSTRLTVTQPLFQGFKEFAGLKQTKTLVQASQHDWQQAATTLYENVAASFFTVITDEQDIDDIKDELAYYDTRVAELQHFVRIGRNQVTDVLTAQSQQAALFAQMKQEEGQLRAQRAVLAFLTGFDPDVVLHRPTEDNAPIRRLQDYLDRLEMRPDVQGDAARRRASEEGIKIARAGHFPTLGFQADYYLQRTGPLQDVAWDAMLTLTVPIFSGGIVSAQVDQATSQRDQADYQVSMTRRTAIEQIREFYEDFIGDRNQYHAYKLATDLAEKNYKEEVKNFRQGLVTNLDVLTALTTFEESKRSQDKGRFSMLQDFADVEAAGAYRPAIDKAKR